MRLIHLSDLHIGKRVNEFSMIEDQRYILAQILHIIDETSPDGVLISGDVYDKSVPSEEAVKLLDEFLTKLAGRDVEVFIISGNHDSAVKLSFASGLIDQSGIHISPVYNGKVTPFVLSDAHVSVNVYMLPFVKPIDVRAAFPEEADRMKDYTDACRVAIEHMEVDETACNVLLAHQFVTGASRCESEEISVGGLDNVDVTVFDSFDYVALGHIHGPQKIGRETVRYCGTPLKYSFSEEKHHKSVTIVTIADKNRIEIETKDLHPLHDLRQIRGSYEELTCKAGYEGTATDDYIHAVLTDEQDIPHAMAKLRVIYPNLMKLTYDNARTRENRVIDDAVDVEHKSPMELFEEFYEMQNNQPMSEEQRDFVLGLIESIWKED
ncbi:MAG: exonuclease SbcCD subunit D [bacterium]|nr:exonuclease SbcCD subunit D [bacterium]